MRTLDEMIDDVLGAKSRFDETIVGSRELTALEKLDAWEGFLRRWRVDLALIALVITRREEKAAA